MSQRLGRYFAAILLLTLFGAVGAAGDLWAQGCSMCGSTLENGDPLAQSISRSVVLMASMPFALFVTVAGWLTWKMRRAANRPGTSGGEETDA